MATSGGVPTFRNEIQNGTPYGRAYGDPEGKIFDRTMRLAGYLDRQDREAQTEVEKAQKQQDIKANQQRLQSNADRLYQLSALRLAAEQQARIDSAALKDHKAALAAQAGSLMANIEMIKHTDPNARQQLQDLFSSQENKDLLGTEHAVGINTALKDKMKAMDAWDQSKLAATTGLDVARKRELQAGESSDYNLKTGTETIRRAVPQPPKPPAPPKFDTISKDISESTGIPTRMFFTPQGDLHTERSLFHPISGEQKGTGMERGNVDNGIFDPDPNGKSIRYVKEGTPASPPINYDEFQKHAATLKTLRDREETTSSTTKPLDAIFGQ